MGKRIQPITLSVVVLVQLIAIFILGNAIYEKRFHPGHLVAQVSSLGKDAFIFPEEGKLKYFYEPKPHALTQQWGRPEWLSYDPFYSVNTDALNERFDYTIPKPPDTFRIITLGDSRTFGIYVDTKDNYPEILENLLSKNTKCKSIKKFEVINLGVPGYEMKYELERFIKRGVKYDADLVLWFVEDADFSRNFEQMKPKLDLYASQLGQTKNLPSSAWVDVWEKAQEDVDKEYGRENIINYQTSALYKINDYYRNKIVFFARPQELTGQYKTIVDNFTRARGNASLYLDFPDLRGPDVVLPDGHPNQKGYRVIAENLFSYLTSSSKIVSCQ